MRKRYWRAGKGVFLLVCYDVLAMLLMEMSLAVMKENSREKRPNINSRGKLYFSKVNQRRSDMVAKPHFQQAMNPVNENKQNPPVGKHKVQRLFITSFLSGNMVVLLLYTRNDALDRLIR